jgi:hypothetical protein
MSKKSKSKKNAFTVNSNRNPLHGSKQGGGWEKCEQPVKVKK